jgi:hypothetical protein
MTLTLPADGEMVGPLSQKPGPLKTFRFTAGIGGDVVLGAAGTVTAVNVPIGWMIHDVHSRIITAFTTSVTLDIGDGVDPNGYLTTTIIAPTTAVTTGIYKGMVDEGSTAYAGGHSYQAADTIDIVVGGTTVLAGLMEVVIFYTEAAADS